MLQSQRLQLTSTTKISSRPHILVTQQTILWFQPIEISWRTLFSLDLLMMIFNTYVFIYGSKYKYTIGLYNYIYGMLVLTHRQPYINSHVHLGKLPLLYLTNILVWYCQIVDLRLSQRQQLLMSVGITIWYFWQHFLVFFLIMFESFFEKYPTFEQIFLTYQLISLKYYFSIFLNVMFNNNSFKVVRNLPYLFRIIQSFKLAQFKNYLEFIRFTAGLFSQNLQIYSSYWYISKSISTFFVIWLDVFFFWDIQRLILGRRHYPIWLYILCGVVELYGTLSWVFYGINQDTIILESYRIFFWNMIKIQCNYSKQKLKNREKKQLQSK